MKDIVELMKKYRPLILATYKRFHPMFSKLEDKEDLMSEINSIFAKLVVEYNKRVGVDFPFYIKRMLELRTYHFITKTIKLRKNETVVEGFTNDEITFGKDCFEERDELEDLINILSWDDDFSMGKKQKQLFLSILRDKRSVHSLAEEEGVNVSTIHTRLHFLVKKLRQQQELQEENLEIEENLKQMDILLENIKELETEDDVLFKFEVPRRER
jgi:RNA polymerase sigma factor (sigma-70 family)